MANFCENCGAKLNPEQDVCLKCGKVIKKEVLEQPKKSDNNTYFIISGVIMILLSICLLLATGSAVYNEYYSELATWIFLVPGMIGLLAAIVSIACKKSKDGILWGGLFYFVGAIVNTVSLYTLEGHFDVSIFGILSCIFGFLNIYVSNKM